MQCSIFLIIFIVSLSKSSFGADDSPEEPWSSTEESCKRGFLRQMFQLFTDEMIDNKIQDMFNKLKTELQQPKRNIAFTAQLGSEKTYDNEAVLKFTNAITNIGRGLNTTNGVFYSPEEGVYSFFVNIQSTTNGTMVKIYQNEILKTQVVTSQGGNLKSGSNQVNLHLQKGDKVSVKSSGMTNYHRRCSFSGQMLHA